MTCSYSPPRADILAANATGDLHESLRQNIIGAVHLGHLRPGDRLPSIREVKRRFGLSHHAAAQVYDRLAAEGLIEKRERSGVYVADPARPADGSLAETGSWIAALLAQACEHHIRIPLLPELIRRWTTAVPVRCACIESDEDHLHALCREFSWQFGAECTGVPADLLGLEVGAETRDATLPAAVRQADILITTTFYAPAVRRVATALCRPLIVAMADPQVVAMIEGELRRGPLTLVCADARFGERIAAVRDSGLRGRLRVVLARDAESLARLDPREPILLTRAARALAGCLDIRLLTPEFPAFSIDAARAFASHLVQFNMEAERRRLPGAGAAPAPPSGGASDALA